MGKGGKVDCGVASDGLGADETTIDRVEVEGAMDGMVGESERHSVVHLVEENFIVSSVGGNGSMAAQKGIFGSCTVEESLETGFALKPDKGVGGHKAGGLHIGSPMVARNDAAATILETTSQYGVHAVGSQFDHCQSHSPSKSGMG